MPRIVRLYSAKGPDRVAVVSTEPATSGGSLIRIARGKGPGPLKHGTVLGPFVDSELETRFDEAIAALCGEGFAPAGLPDLLARLNSPTDEVRARAALGLGWRRAVEAVEPILARLPKAVDETCSYLDALGAIGDPRAVPVLREQAARKLLSRRRSAVEALRHLGDEVGLAAARQQALERLPATVRAAYEPLDPNDVSAADAVAKAILAADAAQQGLALDTLYELATPLAGQAVRRALEELLFDRPNVWRYVKSIHKRSLLRFDHVMFGWLSHMIERQGRVTIGVQATVKSGYDGVSRKVRIFSRRTQNFMRRLSWRHLRNLAIHRPAEYAPAAAEALIAYDSEDSVKPRGLFGMYHHCYLLTRILWSGGDRFQLSERSLRYRFRTPGDVAMPVEVREEAYPDRWDEQPRAFLRLLTAARLVEVHAFAVRAVEARHPKLLHDASAAEIVALLRAPFAPTVELGLREIERRFDPAKPDWLLLDQLLADERPVARNLGERWLQQTAPLWLTDVDRTTQWLMSPSLATRDLASQLVIAGLDAKTRPALAQRILTIFRSEGVEDDRAGGLVQVARAILLDDLDAALPFAELVDWIGRGKGATLTIAGELLGRRPERVADVDPNIVIQIAQHDVAAVRAGVQTWLRRQTPHLARSLELLFALADSAWKDTREVAVEALRTLLSAESLGLDEAMRLLDSSEVDVQNFGQALARERLGGLPAQELVFRLVQHPHPNMRRFALELAMIHLAPGAEPLERLEAFFRAVLFDLWPDRSLKHQTLAFLTSRGLCDEGQAVVAARILSDIVRTQGRGDFELALEGLVRLKLAFDDLDVPIRLRLEDVA
jgi:hypothetical protein